MTTVTNRVRPGWALTRAAALCLLALAATLVQSREARAQWTTSGTTTTTTNNVGIVTTTPEGILDVGNTDIRLKVTTTDLTDKYGLRVGDAGRKVVISSERGTSQQALVFGDTTLGNVFGIGTSGDTGATWSSRFVVNQNGNVGIGTNAPAAQLDLRVPTGDVVTRFSNAGGATGSLDIRYKFELQKHRMGLTDANGQWMFYTQYAASNVNSVGFFPGKVGIGTEAPGYPLTVRASTNIAPLNLIGGMGSMEIWKDANPYPSKAVAFGSAVPGTPAGDDIHLSTYNGTAWTSRLTVSNATGNVGIATQAPTSAKLVIGGAAGAEGLDLASSDQYANLRVIRNSKSTFDKDLYLQFGAGAGSKIRFFTDNNESMTLVGGKLGVGTAAPTAKLDVNGDINVSGNINAKYQDVAEWVPSKQKLAAGTVVVLDTAELNHVQASGKAYDTGVAGVISAQPGISLGEKGEGKLLVATTGRVKVKVDATRGAIKVGDILVTSDVAGLAMKSQPLELGGVPIHRPGTIIGKALEPLEKGTGEILVLLSLQ